MVRIELAEHVLELERIGRSHLGARAAGSVEIAQNVLFGVGQ
jgi:hypothetical protein